MKRTALLRRTPLKRGGFLARKPRKRRPALSGCQIPKCRRTAFRTIEGLRRCDIHSADKLVGDFVKIRDGRCVRCRADGPLDWAHVVSRSQHSLRWAVGPYIAHPYNNSVALCRECHRWQTEHPKAGREFFGSLGIDVDRLHQMAPMIRPMNPVEVVREFEAAA